MTWVNVLSNKAKSSVRRRDYETNTAYQIVRRRLIRRVARRLALQNYDKENPREIRA